MFTVLIDAFSNFQNILLLIAVRIKLLEQHHSETADAT
jgi:hypothetical protein